MAAVKVWGFNEDGFNRVVEATRIVLRTPTTGSKRRRQPPVLSSGVGGGGPQTVIFTIESYDYTSGIAVCLVEYRPNGVTAVSGESEYGTIDVIDPAACFFDETEAALIGRWGTATYMQPTVVNDQYQTAVWVVIGLCCPPA